MVDLLREWSAQGRTLLLSIHWNLTVIGHTLTDPAANLECATMAHRFDRITSDPARMSGQPCIRGMRLTARRVVAAVALYPDREELKREYPAVSATESRGDGDDDHLDQLVPALERTARVVQRRKMTPN